MEIAILGTGKVGGTLGIRWAQKGHHVIFGSREPESERVRQLVAEAGPRAEAASIGEAAGRAMVLVLATPWDTARQILRQCGDLTGKVLIDCINPLTTDFSGLDLGFHESAAERIAHWAPGAHVVKAFNTASAKTIENPVFGDQKATLFYCGENARAKKTVGRLAAELDFEPVDAGPLQVARYLEPMAMFYIHLAVNEGWGSNCAFKIITRDTDYR